LILAARPSQGKNRAGLNLMENIAIRGGHPVAMFSLEMSKESLLQRLVASVAQIDAHKFRTGHLSREDWRRMTESLGTISSAPLWIDDAGLDQRAGNRREGAALEARQRALDAGGGLSAIDHRARALRQPPGRSFQHFAELEGLGKRTADSGAGAQPLTRAPERDERGPQLSDLRESGAIEQDADVVMFIYRPHFFQSGRDAGRTRRNGAANRQAAQRPDRHGEVCVFAAGHAVRRGRAGCLLTVQPRQHVIAATAR